MTFDEVMAAVANGKEYGVLFTVAGRLGVAHRYVGLSEHGEHIMVRAVGDDHVHQADPTELTVIDDDVCTCGQVGCEWH